MLIKNKSINPNTKAIYKFSFFFLENESEQDDETDNDVTYFHKRRSPCVHGHRRFQKHNLNLQVKDHVLT